MSFLVDTKAQIRLIRRALRQAEGYPARGTTVGPVRWEPPTDIELDGNGDPMSTPGWTTDAVDVDVEAGNQACIELPLGLETYLGATIRVAGSDVVVPTRAQLVAENDLPAGLKTARRDKHGPPEVPAAPARAESVKSR